MLNRLCKLCYRHQNVPESAQIVDRYKGLLTDPVYRGGFASVFKGDYQRRPVAIKVVQLCAINRKAIVRVGVFASDSYWRFP